MNTREFEARVNNILNKIIVPYRTGRRVGSKGWAALSRDVGMSSQWLSQALNRGYLHSVVIKMVGFYPEFKPLLPKAKELAQARLDAGKEKIREEYRKRHGIEVSPEVASSDEAWKASLLAATYPSPYPGKRIYT
jgi:hypothetical protein